MSVPDFDELLKVEGMPQGCAWGVFDKDGKKDLMGTLNHLTPDVVKKAFLEVQEGISISLNWPLNGLKVAMGRKAAKHTVLYLPESMSAAGWQAKSFDDELEFNTQGSSQWDSLCHYQHQPSGLAYNGFNPTKESLSVGSTAENKLPTLDQWHSRGCVVGRGVLIDYKTYAEELKIPFHAFDGNRITVEDVEKVAAYQELQFQEGDILIIRTGATEAFDNLTEDVGKKLAAGTLSGLHGSEATARWLWNKRFAAVAGDSMAFEAFPPVKEDGTADPAGDLVLHTYLLSLFGMPIGELWDLKKLAEQCKKGKKYSFVLTSTPLNHPGLVGSPCNALAIF